MKLTSVLGLLLVLVGLTAGQNLPGTCNWKEMLNCAYETGVKLNVNIQGEAAQIFSSMDKSQWDSFCGEFQEAFHGCVAPYKEGCPKEVHATLDGIEEAGKYACATYEKQKDLAKCVTQRSLKRRVSQCNLDAGRGAFRIIAALHMGKDVDYFGSICKIGNGLFDCVDNAMKSARCSPEVAYWIRSINTIMVEKVARIIDCEISKVPEWMKPERHVTEHTPQAGRCDWEQMLQCAVRTGMKMNVEMGDAASMFSSMRESEWESFCGEFNTLFSRCVDPYRGGCPKEVEVTLDGIEEAWKFACDTYKKQKDLARCMFEPAFKDDVFKCNLDAGKGAFRLIANLKMGRDIDYYDHICRIGNSLFGCVDNAMESAGCSPSVAYWIRSINTMMVEKVAQTIDCEISEVPKWMNQNLDAITEETVACYGYGTRAIPIIVSLVLLLLVAVIITVVCCCRRRRTKQPLSDVTEAPPLPEKPSVDELEEQLACTNPVYAITDPARPMTPPAYNEAIVSPPAYTTMSDDKE